MYGSLAMVTNGTRVTRLSIVLTHTNDIRSIYIYGRIIVCGRLENRFIVLSVMFTRRGHTMLHHNNL